MRNILIAAWPLFFGLSLILIGSGLLGTLLGVRAFKEGFGTLSIGVIMSMYYVGFLAGSHYMPKLIQNVGHIRVFAACSAIVSAVCISHGLFPNEAAWGLIRAICGFSFAGLYIVVESWLNQAADNKSRGTIMAAYLVTLYISMAVGQYLLNLYDPMGLELFALISLLVALSVLPISLSSRPAPKFDEPVKVSLKQLYKISPLGTYGVFASGMATACLFSIAPVYAFEAGFSLAQISTFMAAAIIGGVVLQFPIGRLSDRYDRRKVLISAAACTSAFCVLAIFAADFGIYTLYFAMFLIGGTGLTIYGLSSAHTNDHLEPAQIVAASASLLMVNGIGSMAGPFLSTILMNATGSSMLFVTMAVVHGSVALFGLYRMTRATPVPMEQQDKFVPQASPSTAMVMQASIDMDNQLKEKENLP